MHNTYVAQRHVKTQRVTLRHDKHTVMSWYANNICFTRALLASTWLSYRTIGAVALNIANACNCKRTPSNKHICAHARYDPPQISPTPWTKMIGPTQQPNTPGNRANAQFCENHMLLCKMLPGRANPSTVQSTMVHFPPP